MNLPLLLGASLPASPSSDQEMVWPSRREEEREMRDDFYLTPVSPVDPASQFFIRGGRQAGGRQGLAGAGV